MADKSQIEWTDATWNPTTGCSKISEACANCYIDRTPPFRIARRKFIKGHIPLEFHPDRMDFPLKWKRPRKIFVNSLSDLFHEDVPNEYIVDVFTTMYEAQWHTFQVLTKRPERMANLLSNPRFPWAIGVRSWARMSPEKKAVLTREEIIQDVTDCWPLHNVWIGVTAENQKRMDERSGYLALTPAAVRFLSIEPLLGSVVLGLPKVDWVIVGGESGPNARPTHPDWVRSIRDQCVEADVPFFFKQWGEWYPIHGDGWLSGDEEDEGEHPWTWLTLSGERRRSGRRPDALMIRFGKKLAGRLLDFREWSEFPEVSHA